MTDSPRPVGEDGFERDKDDAADPLDFTAGGDEE